jgi:GDP-4-dehydro-6-deoxy-D-mannose reductase
LKVLVTGIGGFVGRHLVSYLMGDEDCSITGVDRDFKNSDFTGSSFQKLELIEADLTNEDSVFDIIKKVKPDQIYHLAAQSSVSYSWEKPVETFRVNVFGGINILEGIRTFCPESRVIMVCTAEEYGEPEDGGKAIDEKHRIYPQNPYAISKSAMDFFSSVYYKAYRLPVFITRSFNHIGTGQSEKFVISDFARQIALIEQGDSLPEIKVGNIEVCRDFMDVRDVVKAYYYIINKGKPGEVYNVCSGEKKKVSSLLDILISMSRVKKIKVKTDRSKFRAIDVGIMYGDNSKLKAHTDWVPDYSIEQSLKDVLEYWREKVNL